MDQHAKGMAPSLDALWHCDPVAPRGQWQSELIQTKAVEVLHHRQSAVKLTDLPVGVVVVERRDGVKHETML